MGCVIKYKGQSIPEEQFLQYLNKQIAINNLFNENENLANTVYKALGFNKSTFDTKGITLSEETRSGWMFIQLNNKKIGNVKLVNNGEKGQLGLSIEINEEYQNKGYGQIVHTLMADLAKKNYKSNLYSDYQNSSQEIQLLNSLVKKGYAEKIGDVGKASKEYPDSFVTEERAFRIKTSDEIQQITPQQKQQAQQLYSQYLESLNKPNTNPILQGNQTNIEEIITQLEKEGLLEIDCKGLKAEKGLVTTFTKGGKWKLIKDLKGYPTHKEGGVDLTIGKGGVSIKNGNTQFTAKHGLVIPKN